MSRTQLLLIRHARIDTGGRLCGTLDVPLSAIGRARLVELVERPLTRPAPDALYTSPLGRAREVADAIGAAWRRQALVADALAEIHCGTLEGVPLDVLRREHADLWHRNHAQQDDDFTWPGGESYRAFRARTLEALRAIAARHPGASVAVVTHAGVISQVVGTIRGRAAAVWEADRPEPLSATEIAWSNGSPEAVLAFNDREWW